MPQRVVIPGGFVQVPPTRLILPGGFTQVPFRPVLGGVAQMNPATFVGPLDAYAADLQVALLPFRGFTAYAGQWCRIRESGGDTEADIGYLANGQPDTAAWTAHVAGNSGFLRTWYDQSGGARNSGQATGANQLQSVLNIVSGYPVSRLGDVNDSMAATIDASGGGRTVYMVVRKRSAQASPGLRYAVQVGGLTNSLVVDNTGTPDLAGGFAWRGATAGVQTLLGGTVTDWSLAVIDAADATTANGYVNNSSAVNFDPSDGIITGTTTTLGSATAAGDADVAAVLLYNAAHDDATREAIQSILAARFGITLAP